MSDSAFQVMDVGDGAEKGQGQEKSSTGSPRASGTNHRVKAQRGGCLGSEECLDGRWVMDQTTAAGVEGTGHGVGGGVTLQGAGRTVFHLSYLAGARDFRVLKGGVQNPSLSAWFWTTARC